MNCVTRKVYRQESRQGLALDHKYVRQGPSGCSLVPADDPALPLAGSPGHLAPAQCLPRAPSAQPPEGDAGYTGGTAC